MIERRLEAYEYLTDLLENEFDSLRFDVDESAIGIAARIMGRAVLRTLAARR